ncbi:MAG: GTPase HflX, partial [Oscillospiraceae bacterium]|nr:GTPase HflX [Oscillospiraceae bacterium]
TSPVLTVFNQCDKLGGGVEGYPRAPLPASPDSHTLYISALTGDGLPALLGAVAAALPPDRRRVTLLLPYSQGALAQRCREEGAVESETFVPEGVRMTVTLGPRLRELAAQYVE